MASNEAFPLKQQLESTIGAMRSLCDQTRELLAQMENRVASSMTTAGDEELCYYELWMRQIRDRLKELDSKIGTVRQMNWKRALQLWYGRDDFKTKMYGHTFRLDFHIIPSLPKEKTAERAALIQWLKDGQRMDCLVMDEHTGEWVFDFKKMEELVNKMLEDGNHPPDSIKLHPQVKIQVRADK